MKTIKLLFAFLFSASIIAVSQEKEFKIPSVDLKLMNGKKFNTSEIQNNGKPVIIDFWATWCKPCIMELSAIAENYPDWKEETGVVLYAVSIDDSKSMNRVAPFINGKGWEFEVLLDPNSDFKRALNVINIPHVFLVDGNGVIVHQHTAYAQGDELILYDLVKKVAKGEKIKEQE